MFMHLNIGSLTFSSLHGLPFWFLLVNMAHHWSSRKGRHGGLLMVLPGQKGSGGHNRKAKGIELLDSLWRRRGKNFTQER